MPDTDRLSKISTKAADARADPFQFTLSTPTVDRYGDIVRAPWRLSAFRKNPVALWGHDSHALPVGTWEDVKVDDGGNLTGRLKLAARETSEFIGALWSLIEQGVLKAVSVGFIPHEAEPLDEDDPWGGYALSDNELLEVSLVNIPANAEALAVASRSYSETVRHTLYAEAGDGRCVGRACDLYKPRGSGVAKKQTPPSGAPKMPTLSERITAKEAEIVEARDQLAAATNDLGDTPTEAQSDAVGAWATRVETLTRQLNTLKHAERAMLGTSGSNDAPPAKGDGAPVTAPRIQVAKHRPKAHFALRALSCAVKGFGSRQDPVQIAEAQFADDKEIAILVRAATAPATTTGAAWAANLMQEEWGAFIELLRDTSAYMQVPGTVLDLTNVTNFPVRNGRGTLAGGFVAENGSIPVKEGSIGTTSLQPHKLAVISAFTKALARRAIPSIQSAIESQVLEDTAEAVDTVFFSDTARTAGTTPAGLQDTTETGAGNVNAVTNAATGAHGSTEAEILADVDALLTRAEAVKARSGVWMMNPAQVRGLANKQNGTTGFYLFRDEVLSGMFQGFPIVQTTNITGGIVAWIGSDAITRGQEMAPMFELSDQATLHFEDTNPSTVSGSTPV
ncbi:MAG: phage major capsid protein, partial [Acidimicrobiia bacterium]